MKELSIEQKAKAYDEALKVLHKYDGANIMFTQDLKEEMFPELKESEDERTWIINYLSNRILNSTIIAEKENLKKAIAWLEKQGEQIVIANKEYWRGYREGKKEILDKYAELEKQDEQKPTDKIEPKFKKGDVVRRKDGDGLEWTVENVHKDGNYTIVNSDRDDFIYLDDNWEIVNHKKEPKFKVGDKVKKGYLTYTVEDIDEDSYKLQAYSKDGNKGCTVFLTIGHEKDYELVEQKPTEWSLPYEKNETVEKIIALAECLEMDGDCLFNGLSGNDYGKFLRVLAIELTKVKPAAWSEEDDDMYKKVETAIDSYYAPFSRDAEEMSEWFKNLKSRVQPQPKQEWSEEDERKLNDVIRLIENSGHVESIRKHYVDWLKSLKPQNTWKPSDKHYELEEFAKIVRGNLTGISKAVQELFEAKYLQLTGNKMYRGFKD